MPTYTDLFNRPNGAIGLSPNGSAYTGSGTWVISSNAAQPPGGTFDALVFDCGNPNVDAQCKTIDNPGGNNHGLALRWVNATNWVRVVVDDNAGGNIYLQVSIGGSVSTWNSAAITWATGKVVRCVVNGNVYDVYYDGTHLFSYTDSGNSFITVTYHGLEANGTTARIDDMIITTAAPASPTVGTGPILVSGFDVTTPTPPPTVRVFAAPAVRAASVPGGLFDASLAPPILLRVVDRSDMVTDLGTLDGAHDRTWQDTVNDAGSGQFVLDAADPDNSLLTEDTAVRVELYGRAVFTFLVETGDQLTIAPTEEVDQVNTIAGRSNLALLEEAVVYPSRGVDTLPVEDDRAFNWTAPSSVYDDSGWRLATALCTVGFAQSGWPQLPFAQGFPDLSASVIWASSGSVSDAPVGSCFFRRDITIAVDGYYQLCALGDNDGTLYCDGQAVLDLGGFDRVYTFLIPLSAGTHTFAAMVTNEAGVPGHDPGGFVFSLYLSSAAGELDTLIAHSDASWKIVEYPPFPPGMTPGNVVRVILDEAQTRGALTGMELTCTDDVDSAGNPWPLVTDIATKVGTDYLSFLVEMSNTYIDFWIEPASLRLWVWNTLGRGGDSGVEWKASRTITDGTSTAHSTAISSATAAFDSWDVGRRITSDPVGVLPADVTIAAVVDASHATLSAPALTSTTTGTWSIEGTIQSLEHTKVF